MVSTSCSRREGMIAIIRVAREGVRSTPLCCLVGAARAVSSAWAESRGHGGPAAAAAGAVGGRRGERRGARSAALAGAGPQRRVRRVRPASCRFPLARCCSPSTAVAQQQRIAVTPSGAGMNAAFQWSRVTRLPLSRCCTQRVSTIHSWALRLTRAACKIRRFQFAPLDAKGCSSIFVRVLVTAVDPCYHH